MSADTSVPKQREAGLGEFEAWLPDAVLRDASAACDTLVRELQYYVKAEIAPYKYPRAVEFVTSLPRTGTGKVQRFRLREIEGQRHSSH